MTALTSSDGLYRYSFDKEIDGLDKKVTVTVQCIEHKSQEKM